MAHLRHRLIKAGLGLALGLVLAGCAAQYRNHGYIPPQEDLSSVTVGVDTRASVSDTLGAPSAGGVLTDGAYYYVRSRVRHFAYMEPRVIDRQVLAISFDGRGVVSNVERFTLEDGRVVPLARRVTDSGVTNVSFIRQLLGGLGRFDPASAFGGG